MPDERSPGDPSSSGRRPRQRRAVETRRRIYEAALTEYVRVGVEAARVEDIVAAAGVSWSTFFDYFPRKEDVLHEAGAAMAGAFGRAIEQGLERGDEPVGETLAAALCAVREVSPPSGTIRLALLRDIIKYPGRMTAFLADRDQPSWMDSTTRLLAEGQRRGEVRGDYPARAMAAVLLQAWAMSANREAALGRPPGGWEGASRSLGELAVEICLDGMRPSEG